MLFPRIDTFKIWKKRGAGTGARLDTNNAPANRLGYSCSNAGGAHRNQPSRLFDAMLDKPPRQPLRLNILMKVVAGLYHARLGFKALHYIDTDDAERWLLSIDCDLYASTMFDWDGELIPNDELSPTLTYSHGLDRALNRVCGPYRRGIEWKAGAE